jgi:hypothetical protein
MEEVTRKPSIERIKNLLALQTAFLIIFIALWIISIVKQIIPYFLTYSYSDIGHQIWSHTAYILFDRQSLLFTYFIHHFLRIPWIIFTVISLLFSINFIKKSGENKKYAIKLRNLSITILGILILIGIIMLVAKTLWQ